MEFTRRQRYKNKQVMILTFPVLYATINTMEQ